MQTGKPFALYEQGKRDNNEDAIFPPKNEADETNRFFMVCDGDALNFVFDELDKKDNAIADEKKILKIIAYYCRVCIIFVAKMYNK